MTDRSIAEGAMSAFAFAQRVRRRYGVRAERRALQLVFARLHWAPAASQIIVHRPELMLTVNVDARGRRYERSASPTPAVAPRWASAAPLRRRVPGRDAVPAARPAAAPTAPLRPIAASRLPARLPPLVARRSMSIDEQPPVAPLERTAGGASEPPARVLRQPPPRGSSVPTERPETRPSTGMTVRRPLPSMAAPMQSPVPPVNLRHLTDEVIRAIDQRIAAQRERFGRP